MQTLADLKKKHNKAIISGQFPTIQRFRTGLLSVDFVTNGGLPRGRIVEISGKSQSGKTSTSLYILSQFLKRGEKACIIDMERTIDVESMERCGVDYTSENLVYARPKSGEEAIEILVDCCELEFGMVLVDSVPHMDPGYFLETDIEKQRGQFAPIASLFARNKSRITYGAEAGNTVVLFINQDRLKVSGYSSYVESYGGSFFTFTPSLKLRASKTKEVEDCSGIFSSLTCIKSKVGIGGRKSETYIKYDTGIEPSHSLLIEGVRAGILKVTARGGYYSVSPDFLPQLLQYGISSTGSLGQGKTNAASAFKENPELFDRIYNLVLERMLGHVELSPPMSETQILQEVEAESVEDQGLEESSAESVLSE